MEVEKIINLLNCPENAYWLKCYIEQCFQQQKADIILTLSAMSESNRKKQPNYFELCAVNINKIIFYANQSDELLGIEVDAYMHISPTIKSLPGTTFAIPDKLKITYQNANVYTWQELKILSNLYKDPN